MTLAQQIKKILDNAPEWSSGKLRLKYGRCN